MNMSKFQNDHYDNLLTGIDGAREKILRKYFNKVCDKNDWKAPISAKIHKSDLYLVDKAIMYYTGTSGSYVSLDDDCTNAFGIDDCDISGKYPCDDDNIDSDYLSVIADGYRMGPCGP